MASPGKYTPVRILVPFLAGIIIALGLASRLEPGFLICICCSLYFCYLFSTAINHNSYGFRWFQGILAQLCLIVSGITLVAVINNTDFERDSSIESHSPGFVLCRIDEKPEARARSFSCKATVLGMVDSSVSVKAVNAGMIL